MPAVRAARSAPTTPPEGPDRIVRTGSVAATSAEMLPPEDCMTRRLKPVLWTLDFGLWTWVEAGLIVPESLVKRFKYRPISGCRYALIATVDVRSYSRYSGSMRWEIDNGTPS